MMRRKNEAFSAGSGPKFAAMPSASPAKVAGSSRSSAPHMAPNVLGSNHGSTTTSPPLCALTRDGGAPGPPARVARSRYMARISGGGTGIPSRSVTSPSWPASHARRWSGLTCRNPFLFGLASLPSLNIPAASGCRIRRANRPSAHARHASTA